MHEVQTVSLVGVPPMVVRTVCTLGFQRRGVRRCEWEMLLPKPGPLPQTSHLAATVAPPGLRRRRQPRGRTAGAHAQVASGISGCWAGVSGSPGTCLRQPRQTTRSARTDPNRTSVSPVRLTRRARPTSRRRADVRTAEEVDVTAEFGSEQLTDWASRGEVLLRAARHDIDALNVFPVPDGDTGTNLLLTWQAASSALAEVVAGEAGGAVALADAAAACIILEQFLRSLP